MANAILQKQKIDEFKVWVLNSMKAEFLVRNGVDFFPAVHFLNMHPDGPFVQIKAPIPDHHIKEYFSRGDAMGKAFLAEQVIPNLINAFSKHGITVLSLAFTSDAWMSKRYLADAGEEPEEQVRKEMNRMTPEFDPDRTEVLMTLFDTIEHAELVSLPYERFAATGIFPPYIRFKQTIRVNNPSGRFAGILRKTFAFLKKTK